MTDFLPNGAVNLLNQALELSGQAPLDDAGLEALLLQVGAQRSRALEQSVRNETVENRASNARVNQLNSVLQDIRALQPSEDEENSILGDGLFSGQNSALPESTRTLLDNLRTNDGTSFSDAFLRSETLNFGGQSFFLQRVRNDGDYQRLTENVRSEVDQASSDAQLNLIRLQGLINRNNQATEFVTNVVQRFSGLSDRIIPNFRQ